MASNSRSKASGHNKKMLNNFVDSFEIGGGTQQIYANPYARKSNQ